MNTKQQAEVDFQEQCREFCKREILCCDTMLIEDLIALSKETYNEVGMPFSIDMIDNLYESMPMSEDVYDITQSIDMTLEEIVKELERLEVLHSLTIEWPDKDLLTRDDDYEAYLDELADEFSQAIEKARNSREPQGILEWHRVTRWLADKLEKYGEPILRNQYGVWWGRTTTGQEVYMDNVIQSIAKE